MLGTISIEAKVVGQKRSVISDWTIPIPPIAVDADDNVTLRDLITWTVNEEVCAFRERQETRRLELILTKTEIEHGVKQGKIDMGGHDLHQEVNAEQAVAIALQAFMDGVYFVFVNDHQYTSLDDVLLLKPESHVMFLRLVALAGG